MNGEHCAEKTGAVPWLSHICYQPRGMAASGVEVRLSWLPGVEAPEIRNNNSLIIG